MAILFVSRSELAEYLGVTPTKVTQLAQVGGVKSAGHSKYDLTASIQSYIDYCVEGLVRAKINEVGSTGGNNEEDLQYWKMTRQKTAALKEMGITLQLENAERLMSSRLSQIRNVLISIDATWAPYMVGIKTVEDAQKMLGKQVDQMFEQLSSLQDFDDEETEVSIETEAAMETDEVNEIQLEDIIDDIDESINTESPINII
jgi:hypothetical protein